MKKEITVTISDSICEEALEDYYEKLWEILQDQYGKDVLQALYNELQQE